MEFVIVGIPLLGGLACLALFVFACRRPKAVEHRDDWTSESGLYD